MALQVTNVSYDRDTGILDLRLNTGDEYRITNPGHARKIMGKISPGGRLTDVQYLWLETYRIKPDNKNRKRLVEKLRKLRAELERRTPQE